jgi:uncharacterized protein (DUF1015 family)
MSIVKPFRGLRPPVELVKKLASRPYDVLNSNEARIEAKGNPYSLLHVTKAEIDLPEGIDEHSQEVYDKVVENFRNFREHGWLVQDKEEKLYIYAQTMDGRTQYGIVGCTHIDDYFNNHIKKHELTRKDKEDDRMIHVRITNANVERFSSHTPLMPASMPSLKRSRIAKNLSMILLLTMVSATISG